MITAIIDIGIACAIIKRMTLRMLNQVPGTPESKKAISYGRPKAAN